ncbi:MAG: nucleoside-diphosphate kinase [Candidatus Omnitrophota bacterium]
MICAVILVSFSMTSSVPAVPPPDTLRPIASAQRAASDLALALSNTIPLAEESITKLVIFGNDIKALPQVASLIKILNERGYNVHIFPKPLIEKGEVDLKSYLRVVRHAGVSAENALFIDDRQDCVDGAIRTGLKTLTFNPRRISDSVKAIADSLAASGTLKKYLDAIAPAKDSPYDLIIFDQGKVAIDYDYQKLAEEFHRCFGIDSKIAYNYCCVERLTDTSNPMYKYENADYLGEGQLVEELNLWIEKETGQKEALTREVWEDIYNRIWIGNIPETIVLIKALRAKGYKVRGLANTGKIHNQYIMDPANKIGITAFLERPDHFYASCDIGLAKPDPLSFKKVCEDAGVSENKSLMVDDLQGNLDGAREAGLGTHLFNPQNALGSVRDISMRLWPAGTSVVSSVDVFPTEPIEFGDDIALAAVKPDAKAKSHPDGRDYTDAIVKDLVNAGLEIVSIVTKKIDLETAKLFYQEHRGAKYFDTITNFMCSDEVTLIALRGGKDAYKKVRDIVGDTDGITAGTIRNKYKTELNAQFIYIDEESGEMVEGSLSKNRIHASDSNPAVLRETGLTHNKDELSKIFKVSNIPKVDNASEYLAEFRKRFSFKPGDTEKMKARFTQYLADALSGKKSIFRINKGHIGIPTGNEKGRYLRLEVGGTNVRVGLVELFGDHKYDIYQFEPGREIPAELKKGDGAKLFDFFAECIAEFIEKYEKDKGKAEEGYDLTFIFSFGVAKTKIDEGIVYEMTKEYKVKGVVGNNLKDLLNSALARRGIEDVRIVAVGNDTESLTAGAAYLYAYCLLCFILSTGYNIGLISLGDIYNTEAGNWKDEDFLQNRSSFDIWLDLNSIQPIEYAAEKTLSGTYVGELTRIVLYDMIKRGLLFKGQSSPALEKPWAFETKYVSEIGKHTQQEVEGIRKFLETIGISNASDEDCRVVWKVADMVTTRAAEVVGVHLSTAIDNTDYDFTHILNMLGEGAFIELSPVMQPKIMEVLKDFYGSEASEINIVVNRAATKVGAAVMAAKAKNAKSSSAGINAEIVSLIVEKSETKRVRTLITNKVLSEKFKLLKEFANIKDLTAIITKAVRARYKNLTKPLTKNEVSTYIDIVDIWAGRGFTLTEDASDYAGAVQCINELTDQFANVKEAVEFLKSPECKIWQGDSYHIALEVLKGFADDKPIEEVLKLIEEQRSQDLLYVAAVMDKELSRKIGSLNLKLEPASGFNSLISILKTHAAASSNTIGDMETDMIQKYLASYGRVGDISIPTVVALESSLDTRERVYIFWAGKEEDQAPYMLTRKRINDGADTYEFAIYRITNIKDYNMKTIAESLGIRVGSGVYQIFSQIVRRTNELASEKLSILDIVRSREIVASIQSQA